MDDRIFDANFLQNLDNSFGTPLYIYDANKLRQNIAALNSAVSTYFDNYRIQYPIKTNSNPHLLKIISAAGLVADCSSPAEIYIAQKSGFNIKLSTYTGNYEDLPDFKAAVQAGMIVNLDDIRVQDLLSAGKPEVISFRINPGIGRGGFEGIITGGTDAKFGIPYEKTIEAYSAALKAGFTRFGIHMMTGSNILEPFYFAEITQKLLMIAGETFNQLEIQPEFINIGGGLGIPYTEEEKTLDLDLTFRHVHEVFEEGISRYKLGNPTLVLEPGRFITGNTGVLLSRVTHIKNSYRNYIGINAGMNTLIRPSLYQAYHKISFIPREKRSLEEQSYYITGQICENSDIHPLERPVAGIIPGDYCLIHDTGAYGYVMASNYNHRPRPAEVLIDHDKIELIRTADTMAGMFSNIPGFDA